MKIKSPYKIITIIKHEYITKVKSKGFILSTLLGPLGLLLFIGVLVLSAIISEDSTSKKLAIRDYTNYIGSQVGLLDSTRYFIAGEKESELQEKVFNEVYDGYLVIPENILDKGEATVFTRGGGGLGYINALKSDLGRIVRLERLKNAGADTNVIKLVESGVDIITQKITESGTEKDYAESLTIVGYLFGFFIYILMIIYGASVMRGVIEEKANRILEVLASSAKPFEIMMGKIVGIGAVGLTQILVWIILGGIALSFSSSIIELFTQPQIPEALQSSKQMSSTMNFEIPQISPFIVIAFLFYFLAGYFIYSTLFAAVGSAVDQESDAQQLQWPVMIPIIIPMVFINVIMVNPESTLSTILSLIPFFTPILMIVRIASSDVPLWQIFLSVILLLATFYGCVWVAAKIYRIGILMTGKKPQLRDLLKWIKIA